MSMIKCPECNKNISIKAKMCPNCGFPLNDSKTNINDVKECQNKNKYISNNEEDIIEREFLLANIQNIHNLHYLSRNLNENISCLSLKRNNMGTKITFDEPVDPGEFELPYPPKRLVLMGLGIMIPGIIFWPAGLAAVIIHTIYGLIENKKAKETHELLVKLYQEELIKYIENVKTAKIQYDKEVNIAIPNLTKAIENLVVESNEASELLRECYEINIIPSKYRNICAITFIYDYLSTSKGTLRDALFACDLDKIQSQLEKVIQNQSSMICKLAKIAANSEKQIQQHERMINHLKSIESNTSNIARTSELSAKYNKIIAHNTKVMAYCSAMTYIDNHTNQGTVL